jgi:hypothetical protein
MVNVPSDLLLPCATFPDNQDWDLIVWTQPGGLTAQFTEGGTLTQKHMGTGNIKSLFYCLLKGFRLLVFGNESYGPVFKTSAQ